MSDSQFPHENTPLYTMTGAIEALFVQEQCYKIAFHRMSKKDANGKETFIGLNVVPIKDLQQELETVMDCVDLEDPAALAAAKENGTYILLMNREEFNVIKEHGMLDEVDAYLVGMQLKNNL